MLPKHVKETIERATVTFPRTGGLGVLAKDDLIVTAAHCIGFDFSGGMVLGDYIEEIVTAQGEELKVTPLTIEPIQDIAILSSVDTQVYIEEAERFEIFCERTKQVPFCLRDFELDQRFPVYIFTHKKTWVTGNAYKSFHWSPSLSVEFDEQIEGGTSGGPIINESGELVGVVSHSNLASKNQKCVGRTPIPQATLPVWVVRRYLG